MKAIRGRATIYTFLSVASTMLVLGGPGHAGGYDTGERDWDFLFQESRFSVQIGATHIRPNRMLRDINGGLGPSADTPEAAPFSLNSLRLGFRIGDDTRCMASVHQPYGGRAAYDPSWSYAASAVRQDFSSRSLDLTCAYSVSAGAGRMSFVLGASDQRIRYVLEQDLTVFSVVPGQTLTDVSDSAITWRAGLAYELPEYALRASIIYNSGARYRPSGTFSSGGLTIPVEGNLRMPASLEVRVQSGIAERTLGFASITRSFWSQTGDMFLCPTGTPDCSLASSVSALAPQWRDTTRVTVGLARQITDRLTLTGALTHDQGASRGFTSQSSVRSLTLGTVIQLAANADLNVNATYGIMAGGSVDTTMLPGGVPNPAGYVATYGRDRVMSLRAAMTFRF